VLPLALTSSAPAGADQLIDVLHGLRSLGDSLAPPVATRRGPFGAEESIPGPSHSSAPARRPTAQGEISCPHVPSCVSAPPFPVIYAPTASGKSALAIAVARRVATLGGSARILAADAFQVYRGMDIGTAKPTMAERADVPHELIDIADPHAQEPFTVDDWLEAAEARIAELRARGVVPIVVGGTALYVQALLHGLFKGPPADEAMRSELRAMDPAKRRAELERADPLAATRIHPADERRTIRAIEVFRLTGTPISTHQQQWSARSPRADARLIVINWPTPELNKRINARVRTMMAGGLLEEVRRLREAGPMNSQAREGLGYKQLGVHLDGGCSLEDAVERTKIETRRLGKNQRTWLKRLASGAGTLMVQGESDQAESIAQDIAQQALA